MAIISVANYIRLIAEKRLVNRKKENKELSPEEEALLKQFNEECALAVEKYLEKKKT